jgi:exonuclease VII small subunit
MIHSEIVQRLEADSQKIDALFKARQKVALLVSNNNRTFEPSVTDLRA